MKNLKEYLTEAKVKLKEPIYLYFSEELTDAESLDDIIEEFKPISVLGEKDYDEEEDQIKVKGKWEFYASENTNYYADDNNTKPQKGDLVFELSSGFALYRPNLGVPSGFMDENAVFGTKQEIIDNLREFSKEFKSDWGCDVKKLLGMK